ncbi:MAG: hypothetical protein WC955_12440, partial [Elusimicrobiota bacterium]
KIGKGLVLSLPWGSARGLGRELGMLAKSIVRKRDKLMLSNLTLSFPEKDAVKVRRIANDVWKNIGLTLIEFIKLDAINKNNIDDFVVLEGTGCIDDALKAGKGVILITAHFGNWEYIATSLAWKGYPVCGITHALENGLVDKMVKSVRAKSGAIEFSHTNGITKSLAYLRENMIVEIAVDQSIAHGGIFINFFNRPAASTPAVSLLERKSGAAVIAARASRGNNGKNVITFTGPIKLKHTGNIRSDAVENTQMLAKYIEEWVRNEPELWFWVHNRWKRQPGQQD